MSPKMNKILISMFLLTLLIFSSCDYQPTGTNYNEVNPEFVPDRILNIKPDRDKLILIENNKVYHFNFSSFGNADRYQECALFLDTTLIYQKKGLSGTALIQKDIEEDEKYYKLTLVVFSGTGTKSFADLLGMEGTLSKFEWDVKVYNYKDFNPKSPVIVDTNGSLKISWEKYPNKELFTSYTINKYLIGNDGIYYFMSTTTINDINKNYFIDEGYIGEAAAYDVVVKYSRANNALETKYLRVLKNQDFPSISVNKKSYNEVELSWGKSKYFNNIKGYRIISKEFKTYDNGYDKISEVDINEAITNSYTLKDLPIGSNFESQLLITSKQFDIFKETYYNGSYAKKIDFTKANFKTGDSSFKFSFFFSGEGKNYYTFNKISNYTYLISKGKTDKEHGSLGMDIELNGFQYNPKIYSSPSGKYIAFVRYTHINFFQDANFPKIDEIKKEEIANGSLNVNIENCAISDNGILAVASKKNDIRSQSIHLYNVETKSSISSFDVSNKTILYLSISPMGDYLAYTSFDEFSNIRMYVYKIINNKVEQILDYANCFVSFFDPKTNNKLYYNGESFYSYLDCKSLNSYKLTQQKQELVSLDYNSDKALFWGDNNFSLNSISNGYSKIFEFKASSKPYLKDGYLYFISGLRCKF